MSRIARCVVLGLAGSPQKDGQGRVTYGNYEQAYAPRQIQLALKLSF